MAKFKYSLVITLLALSVLTVTNTLTSSADAGGACGRGCHRSMGSCTVEPGLWSGAMNARKHGVTLTSCCRTKSYNQELAACGYPVARNSKHMSGQAVDIKVSPANCNGRSLARYGFHNVCPLYHFNHCHVSICGDARSYRLAKNFALRQANVIRARNMRKTYQRHSAHPISEPGFLLEVFR